MEIIFQHMIIKKKNLITKVRDGIYSELIKMIDTYNNPPEELENECAYCGEPCSKTYCNSDCRKAYESDN